MPNRKKVTVGIQRYGGLVGALLEITRRELPLGTRVSYAVQEMFNGYDYSVRNKYTLVHIKSGWMKVYPMTTTQEWPTIYEAVRDLISFSKSRYERGAFIYYEDIKK